MAWDETTILNSDRRRFGLVVKEVLHIGTHRTPLLKVWSFLDAGWQLLTRMPNNMYCTCAVYIFHSNLIFVSLPDEGSRTLLKRCILFFGFTDADMREMSADNSLKNYLFC